MTPERRGRRKVLTAAVGLLFATRRAAGAPQTIQPGPREDTRLTEEERRTLLLEMHKLIEVAADQAVRRIAGREPAGLLFYPAGGRLTAAEADALRRWDVQRETVTAVRKLVADAVAWPVYDLLCMIDGAREPEGWDVPWQPFDLTGAGPDSPPGILHTRFWETYTEWRRRRPDPGWTLDGETPRA